MLAANKDPSVTSSFAQSSAEAFSCAAATNVNSAAQAFAQAASGKLPASHHLEILSFTTALCEGSSLYSDGCKDASLSASFNQAPSQCGDAGHTQALKCVWKNIQLLHHTMCDVQREMTQPMPQHSALQLPCPTQTLPRALHSLLPSHRPSPRQAAPPSSPSLQVSRLFCHVQTDVCAKTAFHIAAKPFMTCSYYLTGQELLQHQLHQCEGQISG